MSLIKCPECGHEVSTKAPTCLNCGVRIAGNLKRCPVCNTILLQDVECCPNCNTQFIVDSEASTPAPSEPKATEPQVEAPSVAATTPPPPVPPVQSTQPVEPKKKSFKRWGIAFVFLACIALLALAVWQIKSSREASAEAAFTLLRECNDPRNFEDFINRYPKSRHIEEVQARLEELRQEEIAWKAALFTTNSDIVRDFIDNYPTSTRLSAAQHRIDTLEWRAADKLCTAASYTAYITAHAAGDFITEAYAARDEAIKREARARQDSIAKARADSLAVIAPFQ